MAQPSDSGGLLGSDPTEIFAPQQPSVFADVNSRPAYPKHPIVTIFHLIFKLASILTYVFGGIVADNVVVTWVFVIIFIAFDFWVTKNVTGRLMVGLRWFNEVRADGTTEWKFESQQGKVLLNPYESKVFWIALIIAPVVWIICTIANIFRFFTALQLLALTLLAAILSTSNLIGYIKCARDARSKISKAAAGYVLQAALNQTLSGGGSEAAPSGGTPPAAFGANQV